ncbi:TIR domain-containing protein [Altererythrobacter sp. MF3-039]|uniref:TIR domain-containing protein n=1 Tax=Altererythrobacter sp. MF3-039 TaxID=3252901 RepID=UPI00390C64DA
MSDRQYKAFISYSHADQASAHWLHRRLESYRFPAGLATKDGTRRLQPIFKDREELPAADSLGEAIEKALRNSEALIVLCSPTAAASPWVAKEIDCYKRLHGGKRVFPIIVSGEPPDNFPEPLLLEYDDGAPTGKLAEPIAADMRREGDGRKLAMLKLVAGLAGVELDDLARRDAARKHRRLAILAAASVAGMVGTSALALFAIDQRNDARTQRAEADGLIEYMLTDLREQLEPVGRLEVLDGVGKRAMDYYARQNLDDLSDSELGRRARATHLVAEVANLRGNNEEALPAFRQAARTTQAILSRNPEDPEAMFNHGQSLFWVGYIAWQHGKLVEARQAMETYADISERLSAKDPTNLDWQMEEAYSLSNLGTMDFEEDKLTSALGLFERHLAAVEAIESRENGTNSRALERAKALSWISSTLSRLGRMEAAIDARQREIDIYSRLLTDQPSDNEARRARVYAEGDLGYLFALSGKNEQARRFLDTAIVEGQAQIARDPENTLAMELIMSALKYRSHLNWRQGELAAARRDLAQYGRLVVQLIARDPANSNWNVRERSDHSLSEALMFGRSVSPGDLLVIADNALKRLDPSDPEQLELVATAHLLKALAHERNGNGRASQQEYRRTLQVEQQSERYDYALVSLRAFAAERIGNAELALQLRQELSRRKIEPMVSIGF